MNVYLTFSQIPVLSTLSRKQRRFVVSRCIYPALTNRYLLIRSAAIFLAIFPAAMASNYFWQNIFAHAIAAVLAGGFAVHAADMILAATLRPDIRRFIDEHRSELAAAAS